MRKGVNFSLYRERKYLLAPLSMGTEPLTAKEVKVFKTECGKKEENGRREKGKGL